VSETIEATVPPSLDLLVRDGLPARGSVPPSQDEGILCDLYTHRAPAPGHRTFLRANMVSTIDGAAWGATGRSNSINNHADFRVFGVLRALADVVLVGAGTVRTELYTPLSVPRRLSTARRRAGRNAALATALVTRSGQLPPQITDANTYDAGVVAPIVLTTARGADRLTPGYPSEQVVVTGEDEVDLRVALDALSERGLTRVLTEGGPTLLGALLEARLVDDLCLTTSPLMVGGPATRVVHTSTYLRGGNEPPAQLGHLLHSNGALLARWVLADQ
jgi:riboflavin biosynthesis pyrimidine reductase